jgi:hypothetical protein
MELDDVSLDDVVPGLVAAAGDVEVLTLSGAGAFPSTKWM